MLSALTPLPNIFPPRRWWGGFFLVLTLLMAGRPAALAQNVGPQQTSPPKRILMLFSEGINLPGLLMLEQAMQTEMQRVSTNRLEFFVENLDLSQFPDTNHLQQFQKYLSGRYNETNLDLVIAFPLTKEYLVAGALPDALFPNVPVVFATVNEWPVPLGLSELGVTGIIQRHDLNGTLNLIQRLQPNTRRVVVIGGTSESDRLTLNEISERAKSVEGMKFDFWTNRPVAELPVAASTLPQDTVILLSTIQRDVTGQRFHLAEFLKSLSPVTRVPVYVLGRSSIGNGALGGVVVNQEELGRRTAQLALRVLGGVHPETVPIEVQTTGTPMFDWRELRRWKIPESRLPAGSVVLFRPETLWEQHRATILILLAILMVQASTIGALLAQRKLRRQAQLEIDRQRTELAHVTRVATMGQLASALAHEINQPLGAILRNAEAAELFLKKENPDLEEIRAILADIRADDQRAGSVIEGMRALLKHGRHEANPIDLGNLIEETVALVWADALTRQMNLTMQVSASLPVVVGDRVQLQQVLLNLILNGMDAMTGGNPAERRLTVHAARDQNGDVEIAVSDAGGGIPPEKMPKLFEPFFTTKPDGLGMGLAISKTIIAAHGGKIWAENHANRGATFKFTLPVDRCEL